MTGSRDRAEPPATFTEAANLIADRYADSPDLVHFCEVLGGPSGPPPWAGRFERHLRAVLQANRDRFVRCSAQFTLASVVQIAGEDRQAEAQTLFESFCAEFDGKQAYRGQTIEQLYYKDAQKQLNELRFRAVGMPAPDIAGPDLDGKPLRISDYRGRVVLLNFWGTWCFPCMKLIPHEIELVAQFRDQPFDIVGVNCDSDLQKARDAVLRTKMSWRSFRDQVDDKPTIAKQWKILGFPTLYLIDHYGIIRKLLDWQSYWRRTLAIVQGVSRCSPPKGPTARHAGARRRCFKSAGGGSASACRPVGDRNATSGHGLSGEDLSGGGRFGIEIRLVRSPNLRWRHCSSGNPLLARVWRPRF